MTRSFASDEGLSNLFAKVFSDELPGKRERSTGALPKEPEPWDTHPLRKMIYGKEVEFFAVGQLGMALGLKPGTVRSWEDKGWIPRPPLRGPKPNWAGLPNKSLKGRRLWTRDMVVGIVRIAHEEKVIGPRKGRRSIPNTQFTQRVVALYEQVMRDLKENDADSQA